jgi:hypothetical protein
VSGTLKSGSDESLLFRSLELSGVHNALNLGKLHIGKLSDSELVRDIRASIVLVDVSKVVVEDSMSATELLNTAVDLLVLDNEACKRILGGKLAVWLRAAGNHVTTHEASQSVRARTERLGLLGMVAKSRRVEAGRVNLVGAVLVVVDDILIRMGSQDKVESAHVQSRGVLVVTVNEELVHVGEVELGLLPLPNNQLAVAFVALEVPTVVKSGEHFDVGVRAVQGRNLAGRGVNAREDAEELAGIKSVDE